MSKIPKYDGLLIKKKIVALQDDPRPSGSIKLKGHEIYRVRWGKYRIIYEIRDKELVILILDVDARKDIYKGL